MDKLNGCIDVAKKNRNIKLYYHSKHLVFIFSFIIYVLKWQTRLNNIHIKTRVSLGNMATVIKQFQESDPIFKRIAFNVEFLCHSIFILQIIISKNFRETNGVPWFLCCSISLSFARYGFKLVLKFRTNQRHNLQITYLLSIKSETSG